MTDLFSLSLADISPPNIAKDPDISSLITALDPQFQELSRASLEPLILARIDELPENVLDLLAWQLHADFYDLAGNISMKREAVKGSLLWHMHKGTQWAIHEALRQLDITAEIVNWWDDNSEPYTFKLTAIVGGEFYRTKGRDKLISSIRRAVSESKAARSLMTELHTRIDFHDNFDIHAGVFRTLGGERKLLPVPPEKPALPKLYTGFATGLQGQRRIFPARIRTLDTNVLIGTATLTNIDTSFGVDLDTMQELLQRFERRILDRIDDYEKNLLQTLETKQAELNLKLEDIKAMLQWKGDDENLA